MKWKIVIASDFVRIALDWNHSRPPFLGYLPPIYGNNGRIQPPRYAVGWNEMLGEIVNKEGRG